MATLIILNGDEEFLKERAALEEARSLLLPSLSIFRFPDGLSSYLEDSAMLPLDGAARGFVVFNAKTIPLLPEGKDDVLIVCSTDGTKLDDPRAIRTKIYPKLKTFDDNNEVIKWILKEGQSFNIDLIRVASGLFVNCGNGLRKLSSEITKIAVLTPPGGVASPEDVRSVLCFSAELTPKHVIDAVCEGNIARAIAFYDKLQEGGDETGWIIAYMQRHVLQMLQLAELKGTPPGDAAARMNVHPFVYKKMVSSRSGLWSIESLLAGFATLCDLDIAHKSGDLCADMSLELEIIRLAEESHGNRLRRNGND